VPSEPKQRIDRDGGPTTPAVRLEWWGNRVPSGPGVFGGEVSERPGVMAAGRDFPGRRREVLPGPFNLSN
jgi:hypothetical protein